MLQKYFKFLFKKHTKSPFSNIIVVKVLYHKGFKIQLHSIITLNRSNRDVKFEYYILLPKRSQVLKWFTLKNFIVECLNQVYKDFFKARRQNDLLKHILENNSKYFMSVIVEQYPKIVHLNHFWPENVHVEQLFIVLLLYVCTWLHCKLA
jgi:hypothetical protein